LCSVATSGGVYVAGTVSDSGLRSSRGTC